MPPTPSAFPSLPGSATAPPPHKDNSGTDAPTPTPTQPGISYAKASKTLLPPSSAPQGTSLPPPAHPPKLTPRNSKERLQPSQQGRDSPYARTPSANGRSSKGTGNAKAHRGGGGANANGSGNGSKVINGKPVANWVPEKTGVHAPAVHTRAQSTSGIPAPVADPAIPAVGKKRRQSLRKVLPPTASKLSPFAASFEFVPGAGVPGAGAGAGADAGAKSAQEPVQEKEEHGQEKEQAQTQQQEQENGDSPSPAGSGSGSGSGSPGSLVTPSEQLAIAQTVGSAGAQGDDFRKKGFSAADAEGATEVAGAEPGMQSASADKGTALSIKEEEVAPASKDEEKERLPAQEEREDRPLGAFLPEAFVHASGAFAPLALPNGGAPAEEDDNDAAGPQRTQPQRRPVEEARIPGAVQDSPVADLAWREKEGWWSEGRDPLASTSAPAATEEAPRAEEKTDEDKAGRVPAQEQEQEQERVPPAVEPAQAAQLEPLLRFPAWTPSPAAGAQDAGPAVRDVAADEAQRASTPPLGAFLGSAFGTDAVAVAALDASSAVDGERPADGSSLLTAAEQRDIAATVGSAGAQGDGFVKPGFTEADAQGAVEAEGRDPADQSAQGYRPSEVRERREREADEEHRCEKAEADAQTAEGAVPSPPPVAAPAVDAPAPGPVDTPESPAPTTPSALSSFLSSSFAAPLESGWSSFEPLDERRAEALAAAGPLSPSKVDAADFPTSAEGVAAMPRLDDVLDVDFDDEGKVLPEEEENKAAPAAPAPASPPEKAEQKRGWWNADEPSSVEDKAQPHADGSALLSASEQRDVAQTVGTAGAQGDEFHKKGFSAADAEGAVELPSAGAQSASVGATSVPRREEDMPTAEQEEAKEEEVAAVEDARSGTQTPLGTFLPQAFSGEPAAASTSSSEPAFSSFASTSTPAVGPAPSSSSPSPTPSRSPSPARSRSPSPPRNNPHSADTAPSLTLALASAWHTAPWSRKLWAVVASLAINVGLPFVNGVMLGASSLCLLFPPERESAPR